MYIPNVGVPRVIENDVSAITLDTDLFFQPLENYRTVLLGLVRGKVTQTDL